MSAPASRPPLRRRQSAKARERRRRELRFGDHGLELVDLISSDLAEEATWGEVFTTCCYHSAKGWAKVFVAIGLILLLFYLLLASLYVMGESAKVMTACKAGALFDAVLNPVTGLMVGILATALLQSSSTVTAIIVSLVGAGNFHAKDAVYMVMGANVGTAVTNTICSCVFMSDTKALYLAFAASLIHDLFNLMTVAILFPLEIATGYLYKLSKVISEGSETKSGDKWEGFVKKSVNKLAKRIIISNKKVIIGVAEGKSCDDYYPLECYNGIISHHTCSVGLIACNKNDNRCPITYRPDATRSRDITVGAVCFVLSTIMLFLVFTGFVHVMKWLLKGTLRRTVHKAFDLNGYVAIALGAGYTMLAQSSTITTCSTFTPLVSYVVLQYIITAGWIAFACSSHRPALPNSIESHVTFRLALEHYHWNRSSL